MRRTLACLVALGALLAWGPPARAGYPDPQPQTREPSRWLMGLGVGALHPLGAFAHDAGVSPVVDVVVARELGASRGYGLRLGISATSYSSARREYALPGIKLGVRTSNLLTAVTLGPQVSITRGRWTGVAHAGPGVTWFTTQTTAGDAYAAGKNNFQSACLAGEAGVAVLLQAGIAWRNPTALLVVAGAMSYAVALLRLRRLTGHESPEAIALHMSLTAGTIMLLVALPAMRPVHPAAYLPLAAGALAGGMGQLAVGRAYAQAPAARMSALTYSGVLFTYVMEAVLFHRPPSLAQSGGALLVVLGGVLVSGIIATPQAPPVAE